LLAGWLTLASPLLAWHAERAAAVADRTVLAQRLERLAATLPALRLAVQATDLSGNASSLLTGATDAIAGAALQGMVQEMALQVGATLTSIETLPASTVGLYRHIGLRLSLSVSWPVLILLMQAMEQARPRMIVDDLELQTSQMVIGVDQQLMTASLTVYAFRGAPELRPAQ
jgi:general secretion pathway protein M